MKGSRKAQKGFRLAIAGPQGPGHTGTHRRLHLGDTQIPKGRGGGAEDSNSTIQP